MVLKPALRRRRSWTAGPSCVYCVHLCAICVSVGYGGDQLVNVNRVAQTSKSVRLTEVVRALPVPTITLLRETLLFPGRNTSLLSGRHGPASSQCTPTKFRRTDGRVQRVSGGGADLGEDSELEAEGGVVEVRPVRVGADRERGGRRLRVGRDKQLAFLSRVTS